MKQEVLTAIVEMLVERFSLTLSDDEKEELECDIEQVEMKNS